MEKCQIILALTRWLTRLFYRSGVRSILNAVFASVGQSKFWLIANDTILMLWNVFIAAVLNSEITQDFIITIILMSLLGIRWLWHLNRGLITGIILAI